MLSDNRVVALLHPVPSPATQIVLFSFSLPSFHVFLSPLALLLCVRDLYVKLEILFQQDLSLRLCIYSSNTAAAFRNFCFKRIVSEPVYERHRKVSLSLVSRSSLIYCILNELETSDGQFSLQGAGICHH